VTGNGAIQLALYLIVLLLLVKPLGLYMARVYEGKSVGLDRGLGWLERLVYRAGGIRPDAEQGWKAYAIAMLLFNFAGIVVVYLLQRFQERARLVGQSTGRARRFVRDRHPLKGTADPAAPYAYWS